MLSEGQNVKSFVTKVQKEHARKPDMSVQSFRGLSQNTHVNLSVDNSISDSSAGIWTKEGVPSHSKSDWLHQQMCTADLVFDLSGLRDSRKLRLESGRRRGPHLQAPPLGSGNVNV
ncbi:hypothetical protein O6H91_18G077200 [Diphasiastrum complanatum]|uniref:Uncharacterized protein n=1 Tax=Diphasiastrum complanatum TaxID=34168 RepID=A0ACC2B2T4_DIPCM|nr:hypothetical protein O6H91_18G077200 [Diphasiastrum complanatum]